MRNLIVCCDGTWNDANNKDEGRPAPTNVRRLFQSLLHNPATQLTRYQAGVGTEGIIDKLVGGVFGLGIDADIMDCYYWISQKFQQGDKIFLFGFSRGAFSARSLAGMIARYGLLDFSQDKGNESVNLVERLYKDGYRKDLDKAVYTKKYGGFTFVPESNYVEFVGVWDTVGALGVPNDKAIADLFDNPKKYEFHDVEISSNIKHARHAVAIDEMRSSFTPTLWRDKNKKVLNNEQVKQAWFPGVHSDIGGGYKDNGLSMCTLKWMIDEVNGTHDNKLIISDNFIEGLTSKINPLDDLHDSYTGIMKAMLPRPRAIPNLCASDGTVSPYVQTRHEDCFHAQAPYRNLTPFVQGVAEKDIYAKHPWYWTGIYLEEGKVYDFSATGTWCDASISCGPKGTEDGRFYSGETVHLLGSFFGKIENVYRGITKNEQAEFFLTRREDAPWFCLMGCIANEVEQNKDGTPVDHEIFPIGNSKKNYAPKKSGYLYCFANDAWGFYNNNRNYVTLKVEEKDGATP